MMSDNELLIASTSAWLVKINENFTIAVDESSMAEYIRGPQTHSIPDAVGYCNQVFVWRNNFIPVMDISLLLGETALETNHIAVVAYQEYADQKPKYVGIKMLGEVERVVVMDDTACEWPDEYPLEVQPIVESLFRHEGTLVSVLKIADLCNDGYRDYVSQLSKIQASL